MKKKLSILLVLMMVLSIVLSACSGDPTSGSGSVVGDDTVFFDPSKLSIKAVDDETIEVKLVAITPYFLELAAFPTFAPVHGATVEEHGEAWATDPATYISNGPYTMTEWVPGSHILVTKNENYWNVDALGPETIRFTLMDDDAAQLTAFTAGDLAFIDTVPNDEIDRLSKMDEFHKAGQLGTYYVTYNTTVAPFDDPLVRQAFTLAVDRDYIVTQIGKSGQIPAGAFVPIGLTDADPTEEFRAVGGDYYDPSASANAANLAKAKELLEEAGYPNGEGLPTVEYLYNVGTGHQQIAEALQVMWGELGATVTIDSQEWGTFLNTRKNGDFMVARNGWLGDYNDPISFLDMWITDGGNNDAQWSNTDYDALITQIKNSSDREERMQLMHDAEDIIFDEWMLCPIYYYVDIWMQDTRLDDSIWASPLGYKYFMFADMAEFDSSELNVCVGPDPDTIDPALNSAVDGATMIIHLFDTLFILDKDGTPVPGAAESVEISEDQLTYTFKLRAGLTWSNGDPVTAADFVNAWIRAIDPNTAADYGYMFESIAGYEEAITDPAA